jgi:GNAT superfamily N-acetyltransferase
MSEMSGEITMRPGKMGDLGYIAYRHGVLYGLEYQLEPVFEIYVLESLLKYARSSQDGMIRIVEIAGQVAGFIAIIRIDEESAQLRWFLIEPEYRGIGLGQRLMSTAMEYCREKRFKKVFLWTFKGLDAAKNLYQRHGFILTEQVANDTWKQGIVEERWELTFS